MKQEKKTVILYYAFCPRKQELFQAAGGACITQPEKISSHLTGNVTQRKKRSYLEIQRKLADEILNYDLRKRFNIEFERSMVEKGAYGKPYLKDIPSLQYNISNTDGLVVCAIGETAPAGILTGGAPADKQAGGAPEDKLAGGAPAMGAAGAELVSSMGEAAAEAACVKGFAIGVDAERIKEFRLSVLRKCCNQQERSYIEEKESKEIQRERFFQLWTLKESYIKMTGEGMRFPLQNVNFTISSEDTEHSGSGISCNQPGFYIQKNLGEYWISLCTSQPAEIVWKEWKQEEI